MNSTQQLVVMQQVIVAIDRMRVNETTNGYSWIINITLDNCRHNSMGLNEGKLFSQRLQ